MGTGGGGGGGGHAGWLKRNVQKLEGKGVTCASDLGRWYHLYLAQESCVYVVVKWQNKVPRHCEKPSQK